MACWQKSPPESGDSGLMTNADPFQVLVQIAEQGRKNARGLPQRAEAEDTWGGIAFSFGGRSYVSALGEIDETLIIPSYTLIPRVRDWVLGLANVRGQLVPLLDLGRLIGRRSSLDSPRARMLLVEAEDVVTGLVVDAVAGMQRFPEKGFSRQVHQVPEALFPFLRGTYSKDGEDWLVLSLRSWLQDESFSQVAV